jgi:hypothetical protein
MQFTKTLSILALALTASAAPSAIEARNGGTTNPSPTQVDKCNASGGTVKCCNTGILGITCNALINLGLQSCNAGSQAYCCDATQAVSSCLEASSIYAVGSVLTMVVPGTHQPRLHQRRHLVRPCRWKIRGVSG